MKILVLQPPSPPHMNVKRDYAGGMGVADPSERGTFGHDPGYITLPYMSLLYSTAVLDRRGFEVVFVDAQADNLDIEGVVARVAREAPQVVVSVVNLPSIYGDLEVLKTLRTRVPGVRTVAIGTVVGPLFHEVAVSGAVDAVVRGDPEVILPELIDHLTGARADPARFEVVHGVTANRTATRVEDLNELPDLPYHRVPIEKYWYHGFGQNVKFAAVFASRGCSFKCYYCPYPMGFGERIAHRDPAAVVDEIEQLQKRHGVKGILFRDQVFTMDWEKTHRLCDEIVRRGLKFQWVVETRLDRVNEELLRKMKQAGCVRIHYGLESGDPKLFSRVGKDQAGDRMEQIIRNFQLTEEIGIHPHMFVLIGLLGESEDSIGRTVEVIRRIKPLTLQVAIVTPYPGTPLFEEARKKGLLSTEDWSRYTGFNAVSRTEDLTTEQLLAGRERILREHARAIFWKKRRRKAALAWRYARDGSLASRLWRKTRRAAGGGGSAASGLPARGPS